MEITVFGASGAIGNLFVQQSLNKGHKIKAYVRNPAKLKLSHPNLTIIQGELNEKNEINESIKGSSAVISLLGPPLKGKYVGTPLTDGHNHIISAMKDNGVNRIITLATPSIGFEKDQRSLTTIIPRLMPKLFAPKLYTEMVSLGEAVTRSGLDWTIVRIIAPNNKPVNNQVKVTFGDKKISWGISRADIAVFVLKEAEEGNYIKSMPIIGS